jgi:Septum formation initiator
LQGPLKPIMAARRRRQLHPFFYRLGSVGLSICSVLLISLMAVLYLSQLSQAVTANQEIQTLRQQQATLQREDQDLVARIAQEQSPTYITVHAKAMGLIPSDPKSVIVIVIPNLKPVDNRSAIVGTP